MFCSGHDCCLIRINRNDALSCGIKQSISQNGFLGTIPRESKSVTFRMHHRHSYALSYYICEIHRSFGIRRPRKQNEPVVYAIPMYSASLQQR